MRKDKRDRRGRKKKSVPPRRNYIRLSIAEIEALKPELLETFCKSSNSYRFTTVADRYGIEPGLLMLLISGLWKEFAAAYEANTTSGHYKKFREYKNSS